MHSFDIIRSHDGHIATIDLARPEEGNKLTREMMRQMSAHMREFAADPALRAVCIASKGSAFCLGRDGKGETLGTLSAYEMRAHSMGAVLDLYAAIREVPVPVIARVHADAHGFGAALAGSCDITLASAAARFAFGEINHGIPPTMAMTAVMRSLSPKALSWLIYSGEIISAHEATQIGLASRVWEAQDFSERAAQFLDTLATRPRENLETIKKFQSNAEGMNPQAASDYAGALLALVRSSA